jgi:shikimate dehydrogenase
MTDHYAVFGHPVEHSKSPFIHGLFARQTGQDMHYRKIDVAPEGFAQQVVAFLAGGAKGFNVTVPHKQAALQVVSQLTPRAERAEAVNTVALQANGEVLGDNTDGAGLMRDLRDNLGFDVPGRSILICGAGGATRGVLAPLLELKPRHVVIANRTPERAAELAGAFADLGAIRGCGYAELRAEPFDLVINATSAGLRGDAPPLSPNILHVGSLCYDMSYGRDDPPFLRWARAQGCKRLVKGWGMLVEQAAESFLLWRGVRPDSAAVLAVLTDGREP